MAKTIEVILKKDGSEDITVTCPEKVKLSVPSALLAIKFGLPPADVKPVQVKDVVKCIILFFAIFAACIFFTVSVPLGIIAVIIAFVANIIYNQNYFFNFIRNKIAEGYTVENEEHKNLLQAAGVFETNQGASTSQSKSLPPVISKVTGTINKLPFNSFATKIPVLQNFSKYANYIVCGLAVILIVSLFSFKSPVDSMLDDTEAIARKMTTVIEKCENGNISYSEMEVKYIQLASELTELQKKYDEDVGNISNMNDKQKKRARKIQKELENLSLRVAGLQMQGWY